MTMRPPFEVSRPTAVDSSQTKPFLWIAVLPGIVFFILLFAPNDVLDQWAWARAYTDITLQVFPFMRRHAPHSPHAQVIQLGAVFFVTLIWIQFLVLLAYASKNASDILSRLVKVSNDKWVGPISVSVFIAFAAIGSFATRNGPDFNKSQIKIDTSRLTTAFLESAVLLVFPMTFMVLFFSIYGLLTCSKRKI